MEKTDRQREPNHRNALRARLPSGRFAPFAPPLRVGLSRPMAAQKWLACGQASTRRGTPRRWQLHHRLHPHPAPCPLKGRKKRFSREKRLAEAVPHIDRQRGRKDHRLNAKGKADSQATELASIAIPDEEGPEPYPGRAGAPRKPETGRG